MKRLSGLSFFLARLLLLVCGFGYSLSAQEHSYVHYDVHEGLAGSTVYSMAQDKDGYIWFGTESGLSRFDGTHFKTFTTRDGLPDNEILKLFVDSRNRVWFVPFKHTIGYYWKGRFHTQKNDSALRGLALKEPVESISEDSAGNILLQVSFSLQKFDSQGRITRIPVEAYNGFAFLQSGINRKGQFRVAKAFHGPRHQAILLFGDILDNTHLRTTRTSLSTWWNHGLSIYIGPDLEIFQDRGSVVFSNMMDSTEFRITEPKGFISISRINDSNVVLNTYNSTYLVNTRQKKITDSFLQGQSVNSAIEDSEGGIWFSTLGNGVYRLNSFGVSNYSFKVKETNLGIFSIRRIDSILWLGGDHYLLSALDLTTGKLRSGEVYNGKTRGRIMDLAKKDRSHLVLGTDLGMFWFESLKKKSKLLFFTQAIKSYFPVGDSVILSTSNVVTWRIKLSTMLPLDTIYVGRGTCSVSDTNGSYYIGTLEGLYRLKKGMPKEFLGRDCKPLANRIAAMGWASNGTLWIATNGDGVVGYRDGRMFVHLTESEGLTSNICRSLYVADGNIWVGTDKGLNKISADGAGYSCLSYTMADGLNSDMINAIYTEGSKVYAGTNEGMTAFDEKTISRRSACVLHITGLHVSDRQIPADTIGLVLPHTDNNIKFDFVGISFKSAGNISYRYRLLGLDTTWRTTRETFLSYPSLPSGNYELQLTATNKFGVRSLPGSVKFTVGKLLWERTWFRLLILLSVAAAIMLYFNYRIGLVRIKEAEKTETNTKIAELEQMALRSQMNPHFIFNCLNSIQQYVIYKDVLGANEFITKFAYLIRQTLDISSRPSISLNEEINYIDTYMGLEKKRFDDKFIYEIVVDGEVDRSQCHIPPMILQPYIENAVRHGIGLRKDNAGKLLVRMQYRDGCLVCIVEDNGVGREMAGMFKSINSIAYQSVGMSLVAKRIAMLNKTNPSPVSIRIDDLKDAGGSALGTRINIFFPLAIALND